LNGRVKGTEHLSKHKLKGNLERKGKEEREEEETQR